MKKISFRFLGMLAVLLCVCSSQVVFADTVLIRKDPNNPTVQPMGVTRLNSLSTSSTSFIPVTADLNGSDLIVDFSTSVGTAFVSVVDKSGNVVYQTVVDTFSVSEVIISIDTLSSGSYSLKIAYGTTKLIGDFQL